MTKLFGTNGIRGVSNKDLTPDFATEMGLAIGTFFARGEVAIATDTRTSNQMLKSAIISGLLATGCTVLDVGIAPTPSLQYTVKHKRLAGGVMITASHNPPEFNGIKCVDPDGTEMGKAKEEKIEEIYFGKKFGYVEWLDIKPVKEDAYANQFYINGIQKAVNVELLAKAKFKVVVDCSNGASSGATPYLLENIGCKVTSLNAHPQGTFPGHPSEPTPENLADLAKTVKAIGANMGVALDGDADRAVFIDENGGYIPGEKMLALIGKEIIAQNKGGLIVTPVSTSNCVEEFAKKFGGKTIYTRVGSPTVARVMMEKGGLFGGEENGGLIFPKFQYCRDGSMAAAYVLEIMARTKRKLSDLIDEVPKFYLVKTKIKCPDDKKDALLAKMAEYAKGTGNKFDTTDGTKIFTKDGWVLVRPSGTEPICRVFGETRDQKKSEALVAEYKAIAEKIVG